MLITPKTRIYLPWFEYFLHRLRHLGSCWSSQAFEPWSYLLQTFMVHVHRIQRSHPFYSLAHRFPFSCYRYINIPLFFAGLSAMPPASGINYVSWVLTGLLFNLVIRRRHFRWWMRYNYILSAALDSGLALCMIIFFFALSLPQSGGIQFNW